MENEVKVLLPQIVALEGHFDSCPTDVAGQGRRDELKQYATMLSSHGTPLTLSSQLRGFEEQLRSRIEEQESQGLVDRAQGDDGVFGLLEDMQEAILSYQVRS